MNLPIREKFELIRPAADISPKAAGAVTGGALGIPVAVVAVYIINALIGAFGGADLPVEVATSVGSIVSALTAYIGAYLKAETLPENGLAIDPDGEAAVPLDPGEEIEDYGI